MAMPVALETASYLIGLAVRLVSIGYSFGLQNKLQIKEK